MNKSEDIKDLAKALSLAQAAIKGAKADSVNPFFKSSYADLSSVWDAIRGPFTANGLSVTQLIEEQEKSSALTTVLMHSSGQWISSSFQIRTTKNDPQGFVAGVTYARRTSLSAIAGVAEIDDDGNEAAGKGKPESVPQKDVVAAENYFLSNTQEPQGDFPAFDQLPKERPPQYSTPKNEIIANKQMKVPEVSASIVPQISGGSGVMPPQSVTSTTITSGSQLSEKQIKRLWAIANKNKWTTEQVEGYCARTYKIDSVTKLTRANYDHLCNFMEQPK